MSEMSNWVIVARNATDDRFYRVDRDDRIDFYVGDCPLMGTWGEMHEWSRSHNLAEKYRDVWVCVDSDTFIVLEWESRVYSDKVGSGIKSVPMQIVPIASIALEYRY